MEILAANMSEPSGNAIGVESPESKEPGKLRFLVTIEFSSKDAAVDHFVNLQTTGWPRGPKQENLKLIVISRQWDEAHVEGVEIGTGQLSRLDTMLANLAS